MKVDERMGVYVVVTDEPLPGGVRAARYDKGGDTLVAYVRGLARTERRSLLAELLTPDERLEVLAERA